MPTDPSSGTNPPTPGARISVDRDAAPSFNDRFAKRLRGFGPVGILAILVILLSGNVFVGRMVAVPVGGLLVLAWV